MGKEESCLTAWFQEWSGQADEDSSNQRHLLKDPCMPQTGSAFAACCAALRCWLSLACGKSGLGIKVGADPTVAAGGVINQLYFMQADFSSAFSWSPQV